MRKLDYLNLPPQSLIIDSNLGERYNRDNLRLVWLNRASIKKNIDISGSLKFPGYSSKPNKNKIRDIANGCCAYCGLRIIGTSTEVVEHYRPKDGLHFKVNDLIPHTTENSKPHSKHFAYFKWGSDHKNLLPACDCCNSGYGRDGIYIATKDDDGIIDKGFLNKNLMFGKHNFFPVFLKNKKKGDRREKSIYINTIKEEYALLFNPYEDDPFELFSYRDEPFLSSSHNDQGIKIVPNKNLYGLKKIKAIVSINLLGLNRATLCHQRYDKYHNLSKIEDDYYNLTNDNSRNLSDWHRVIGDYVRQFNPKTTQLIGYAMSEFGQLGFLILTEMINRFPDKKIQKTIDFETLLLTFNNLSSQYKLYEKQRNAANKLNRRMKSKMKKIIPK